MAFDELHMEFCDPKVYSKRSEITPRPIKQF